MKTIVTIPFPVAGKPYRILVRTDGFTYRAEARIAGRRVPGVAAMVVTGDTIVDMGIDVDGRNALAYIELSVMDSLRHLHAA